jgi:phosphopantothenate synthetase
VENWSNFLEHVGRLPNPVHRSSTAASFLNMNIVKEINKCIPEAKTQIQVLELEEQRRKLEETQRNTERQNKLAKVCKTLTHLSETLSNLSK